MASSSAERGARPRALMAALHDWDAPLALGSHHLARGLVDAGWDVAYVSNGISPPQILKDRVSFRHRLSTHAWNGRRHLDGHLWANVPIALLTPHNAPLLRSRAVHRHWQQLTLPNLMRSVSAQGFGVVDLLYIDTPLQSFWLEAVTCSASVARIMDRSSGFHGVATEFLAMERELIRSADLVVHAARSIERELRDAGARRLMYLPNGVDFSHFAEGDRRLPDEYASIPEPRALYIGDIATWFDFEMVDALTSRMPDVAFVFIGPDRVARERITARPNVHILGPRPFSKLPAYVHNAHVGLIPFDVRGFPDAVNAVHPLKLYEYLACGLPVVATRWEELERLASPAMLCDTSDDFATAIREALVGSHAPEASVEFAHRADWSGRVRMLLEALGMADMGQCS